MIERTPILDFFCQAILLLSAILVIGPIWLALVGATLSFEQINTPTLHLLPGADLLPNIQAAWTRGQLGVSLVNSIVMSVGVALGKVVIAAATAFGIVYFRFPGRFIIFWLIFITLMLPLEVRIIPTYAVAANALSPFQAIADAIGLTKAVSWLTGIEIDLQWNILSSYTGLILPLVATATGTFLYRQFFKTVPEELLEAAKMDGAGPFRFFFEILLPISRPTMMALFTIMFLSTWNSYLWPLIATPDRVNFGTTAVVQLKLLSPTMTTVGGDGAPDWNVAMAACLITMLPPLIFIGFMQKYFVRGLVAVEK